MSSKGNLIVISAPSGSGKTSLVNRVLQEIPHLKFSVSHTTRKPRRGERNETDYFFVSEAEFEEMIRQDVFLEHANVYGNYYGTSRDFVEKQLAAGYDVLLDIDVQGARQIGERKPDSVLVFILPPSRDELVYRLKNRGLDKENIIARRLEVARKEIRYTGNYQYVIINREIEQSVCELKSIIIAARCGLEKRKQWAEEVVKTFEEGRK